MLIPFPQVTNVISNFSVFNKLKIRLFKEGGLGENSLFGTKSVVSPKNISVNSLSVGRR